MRKLSLFIAIILLSISISAQLIISEEPAILKTSSGDIYGTLRIPPANKKATPVALLIAGSGPTDRNGNQSQMQNNSLKMLSEALFYNGIASLSFDKRGIGESKNSMKNESELNFDDYVNDVREWIGMLSEDKRFSDIIIIGHSEGSLIGMLASQNNSNVSKYISVAGGGVSAGNILREQLANRLAGQPQAVKDMIFSYIDKLENGETIDNIPPTLNSLFRPSVQPYMISWFRYNPQIEIEKLKIPILIIQGTTDIQVPTEHAELLAKAQPNAKKVIVENMNHVLKDCEKVDMASQLSIYSDPNLPLNKQFTESVIDFIKNE